MNPSEAYKTFTNLITAKESLEIKSGKGEISSYENEVLEKTLATRGEGK